MKKTHLLSLLATAFVCSSTLSQAQEAGPNLVPTQPTSSPHYWCTWYAQNYWVQRGGEITDLKKIVNPAAREELTYKHLFDSEKGWVVKYLPLGRQDQYFLIDHGWQTKNQEERVEGAEPFFSLQVDVEDFPEYAYATPEEQLRLFNEEVQNHGWKGLGIWVRGNVSPELAEQFVKWSKYAGIEYWKIDGGDTKEFNAYQAKQKYYPELHLEYVAPCGNLTPQWEEQGLSSYPSSYAKSEAYQKICLNILKHSDVFRTYDATPQLMTTTTLRRAHDLFKLAANQPDCVAILNLQDDCNAAAALGCLVASKRHPNYGERLMDGKDLHHQLNGKRHMQGRINEVERLGRWARIAPAFAVGEGVYRASDTELVDSFPYTEYSTWNRATYGKLVTQSAPAIMSRNIELPTVVPMGDDLPYVMATRYPNGALAVALEGRVKPENEWYYPKARVELKVAKADIGKPLAIFGYYDSLVLILDEPVTEFMHIYAQDLLDTASQDVKAQIKIEGNKVIIPGDLIEKIGTSCASKGDISSPGLLMQFVL